MFRKLMITLAVLAFASCGVENDDAFLSDEPTLDVAEGSLTIKPTVETFILDNSPGQQPSPSCDVHRLLKLKTYKIGTFNLRYASIENELGNSSTCEILVKPELRSYQVTLKNAGCGSKSLVGKKANGDFIDITDHRTRLCKDLVPAQIIVKEKYKNVETMGYSRYQPTIDPNDPTVEIPEANLGKPLSTETFALDNTPNHTPVPSCDVHRSLTFKKYTYGTTTLNYATIQTVLGAGSTCKIAVVPDARTYRVVQKEAGCGSKLFVGQKPSGDFVEITDHRTRLCLDIVVSALIVKEKFQGVEATLYSRPN